MAVIIEIELAHYDSKMPVKKHNTRNGMHDLGWDLFSLHDVTIPPHEVAIVNTGLKMRIPKDYGVIIKDRSSRSMVYHVVGGVYDPSYRGEINVNVLNFFNHPIKISKHDKFAQMIVIPNVYSTIGQVFDIKTNETLRGDGCLGSTDLDEQEGV